MAIDNYTHFTIHDIRKALGKLNAIIGVLKNPKRYRQNALADFSQDLEKDEDRIKDCIAWLYRFFTDLGFLTLGNQVDSRFANLDKPYSQEGKLPTYGKGVKSADEVNLKDLG